MLLALNYWLFFVPPSLYPQRANQAKCNFWKAYMFSLNESSCFFLPNIHNSLVNVVFFCPLFGFALRHSAVPLFLVQRLVPPNGHRCLNFNFAEGGRKKKKIKKRERFIDFWTPPPSCFFISKLAGGKKRKKRNRRQFLHASLLKRTTCSCSRTYRADIWRCTLHNSALFPSQRVVTFESAPPPVWWGCFPSALRVAVVQVCDKKPPEKTKLSAFPTGGYSGNIQFEQVYTYIFQLWMRPVNILATNYCNALLLYWHARNNAGIPVSCRRLLWQKGLAGCYLECPSNKTDSVWITSPSSQLRALGEIRPSQARTL